ncbi:hypothetical protein BGZ67_004032 [Mortierella alpina]|nr:hypothetical protein BGZ67_004032 [Mortierella alpina]
MSNNLLNLVCLVDGESTSPFPVEISPDDSIYELKRLIMAEKSPHFDNVAAYELTLWRVNHIDTAANKHQPLIANPNGSSSGIMFDEYVRRAFREGGHTFEIKDLKTGQSAQLHIPHNLPTEHFSTIFAVAAAPRNLFQIAISKYRAIKGPPLSKLIDNIIEARWISL